MQTTAAPGPMGGTTHRLRGWLSFHVALSMLLLALAACSQAPALTLTDHPLAGRIWDVKTRRFVDVQAVMARLRAARFTLLGETHDNPEHHRIQTRIFDELSRSAKPALVMEQFDTSHQAAMDAARQAPHANSESIAQAGQFDRKGWDWPLYRPLVAGALRGGQPIVAANPPRFELRRVADSGFDALGLTTLQRAQMDEAWNDLRQRTLEKAIVDGHCGASPGSALPVLVRQQRARDATMAKEMAQYASMGAVAIIGRGHTRRGVAVPLYLERFAPGTAAVVIALMEVEEDKTVPDDYSADAPPELGPAYDFIWFTPRAERADPCAVFHAHKPMPQ